ncbi:CBS domain-containing protein [Pseudomonadota bacterium]
MNDAYRKLPDTTLPEGTPVYQLDRVVRGTLQLGNPAVDVMTDLKQVKAITVSNQLTIDEALQRMVSAGVRLLLVMDSDNATMGVITARDINGEKPVIYASKEQVSRDQMRVSNIMTPREKIEVLQMSDVEKARVGDIVTTLRDAGRQHALVIEDDANGNPIVRGIFSITLIGRMLGLDIQPTGVVQSFAELESVLIGSS